MLQEFLQSPDLSQVVELDCAGGEIMEVSTINTVLGQRAGVLRLVFGFLPPRDLKNVVLVCRLWREVGEEPGLGAWGVIRMTRENMSNMAERLDCRRNS